MGATTKRPVRPDWLSKTLAGLLLGLLLALGVSSLLAQLLSGLPLPIRGQLVMWVVAPVWMAVCGGVYFFASGRRAWLGLGGASLAIYGLSYALQRWAA